MPLPDMRRDGTIAQVFGIEYSENLRRDLEGDAKVVLAAGLGRAVDVAIGADDNRIREHPVGAAELV